MAVAMARWTVCVVFLATVGSTLADCTAPLGMASRSIMDSQISASSTFSDFTKPEAARLRNHRSKLRPLTFGGWCAQDTDSNPFLQIDFMRETVVRQIATQGLEQPSGNWVTQYAVNYSCDGVSWKTYKEMGKRKILDGNDDASAVVRNSLALPIIARFIRISIVDKRQHGLACMRVEVYGCYMGRAPGYTDCGVSVGLEDGRITGAQISASSSSGDHAAANGRLNKIARSLNGSVTWGSWCTNILNTQQYLQVDLGSSHNVSGVATQGYSRGGWVTEYLIKYSLDGKTWKTYKENTTGDDMIFDANWDADTAIQQRFQRVFSARFVRINPVSWYSPGIICMRVEIYHCVLYAGCSQPSTTSQPTGFPSIDQDQSTQLFTQNPVTIPSSVSTEKEGVIVKRAGSAAVKLWGELHLLAVYLVLAGISVRWIICA